MAGNRHTLLLIASPLPVESNLIRPLPRFAPSATIQWSGRIIYCHNRLSRFADPARWLPIDCVGGNAVGQPVIEGVQLEQGQGQGIGTCNRLVMARFHAGPGQWVVLPE